MYTCIMHTPLYNRHSSLPPSLPPFTFSLLLANNNNNNNNSDKKRCLRVGLLGHGAIGSVVAEAIALGGHGLNPFEIELVAVLVSK